MLSAATRHVSCCPGTITDSESRCGMKAVVWHGKRDVRVDQVPDDRVVIPFNISCGACYMCDMGLY